MVFVHRLPGRTGWNIVFGASGLVLLAAGCSSTASDTALGGSGQSSYGDDGVGSAAGGSDPSGGTSGGDETGGGGSDGAGTDATTGTGGGGGPPEPAAACPEPLPSSWVFCEDFEDLQEPSEVFFEYQDEEGAFVLVDDEAASGSHSMRATYLEGKQSAGWLSVVFGRNPIARGARPQYAKDGDFEEIYWRLRVKMEAGWPDIGPHKLTRLTSFAQEDWGQAMIAHLWSAGSDVTLMGDPATCVIDGAVNCSGYNDFNGLQFLGQLPGETPLFSSALSGQWHCVEGHVKLNTPGKADGVFEFWIDDQLENAATDLDWRGSWTEYGLNLVSVENYWNDGAPGELRRWIDDLVISTEPIGCE